MKENETNYGDFTEPKEEKTSKRSEDVLLTALDKIEQLEEKLKEAQNLIIYCSSGNHIGYEIMCELYMKKHHLGKWGVK